MITSILLSSYHIEVYIYGALDRVGVQLRQPVCLAGTLLDPVRVAPRRSYAPQRYGPCFRAHFGHPPQMPFEAFRPIGGN